MIINFLKTRVEKYNFYIIPLASQNLTFVSMQEINILNLKAIFCAFFINKLR